MSKNLLYHMTGRAIYVLTVILLMCFITSCSDEVERFKADISPSSFTFKPVTGGAVMHYRMPNDPTIVGIHARYKDAYGKEMLCTGSHLCDSLELTGFNEAVQNVNVSITVFKQDGTESEPVEATFSTNDSGPIAFIKNAEVLSNWEGFSVKYEAPAGTHGLVNVFYLGTDPKTGEPDTILIDNFNLSETKEPEVKNFFIQQDIRKPVVVLKVEDYRGNMVAQQTYTGVECMKKGMLDPKYFNFWCDNALIDTMTTVALVAPKYLFDGDSKGLWYWEDPTAGDLAVHSFIAGPNAEGPNAHPMYIDLQKNRVIGSVRIYAYLASIKGGMWYVFAYGLMFLHDTPMYPSNVDIYCARDDGDHTAMENKDMDKLEWTKVANFYQNKSTPYDQRWCAHTQSSQYPKIQTYEEMLAADPDFADILLPVVGQGEGYRYIKMVVNETFDKVAGNWGGPWDGYVTFSELEVYTQIEE